MSPPLLANCYLFLYNVFQFFAWTISLWSILWNWASTDKSAIRGGAYYSAGGLICLIQGLAVLEVGHAAVGLVPSGVVLGLMQWGGRTHFLFAIVRRITEIHELPAICITFVAWCTSEIIRYSHYALSGVGMCPPWLTYLRYTAFIFLYPIGVGPGEMWAMYQALPFIKKKNLYSDLFDKAFFSYHSFVMVLLVIYPLLWLKLYLHLFKQRRTKLVKQHTKKET